MNTHTILDNLEIKNIEIGADCGEFGRRFYAPCFLTDIQELAALSRIDAGCAVDFSCAADNIPAPDSRFEKLICANPHEYGFKEVDEGVKLLEEWGRVLVDGGEIVLVGNAYTNKYFKIRKLMQFISFINSQSIFEFTVQENIEIKPEIVYPEYQFYQTNKENIAIPSHRIVILCSKK